MFVPAMTKRREGALDLASYFSGLYAHFPFEIEELWRGFAADANSRSP